MVEAFAITKDMPHPPQEWQYDEHSTDQTYIDPEMVISYDQQQGKPMSRYKDDIWRLTWSLNPKKFETIKFNQIKNMEDRELIKRLLFIIMHTSKGKGNSIKSPGTLAATYTAALAPLHKYAALNNTSVEALFRNNQAMRRYITTDIKMNKARVFPFSSLLTFLSRRQEGWLGVVYHSDNEHFRKLSQYQKDYEKSYKQTECIPPRILRNAQRMRWEHIETVLKVQTKLLIMIDRLMSYPLLYEPETNGGGRVAKRHGLQRPEPYIFFSELVEELGLSLFCEYYGIDGRRRLVSYLNSLSRTCRHLIYGYTGMRNDEGCTLWVGCYQKKGAGKAPVIYGVESKNGIPVKHSFVTIKDIEKVIDLQTALTKTITKHSHPNVQVLPLLFSPKWIETKGKVKYMEASTSLISANELPIDELLIIISEEDVQNTLKATEPDRDWDNDPNYQAGMVWKFNWHQYRRSIAVYSLRSGLVNVSALGNQYRHLFEATTLHYGNGHFVAQPLEGTDSKFHVSQEAERIREEYHSRALWRDMLINLDRPKSGFAPTDTKDASIEPSAQIEDIDSLQTIAAKMKRGEIGHTNTAIGSCKSFTPCDGHMMLIWKPCLLCPQKVPNKAKVDHLIEVQKRFIEKLEIDMPNSIELRDQIEDLAALKEFRITLKGRENGQN